MAVDSRQLRHRVGDGREQQHEHAHELAREVAGGEGEARAGGLRQDLSENEDGLKLMRMACS